jgi:DNA gyrase/topoisomerase IV subunit B
MKWHERGLIMQKIQSENKYAPPMRSKKKIGNTTFIVNSFFREKGDEVEPRRRYIEEHAKDVKHLDV